MSDVVIIGGGMIGLALASALGQADFSVTVIESREPILKWKTADYDARVSAIHLGTQAFFEKLGIWSEFRETCYSPLEHMIVWDAQGGGRITFNAADIGKDVLGYIVENREIVRALWQQCEANKNIKLVSGVKPKSIAADHIILDDEKKIEATLFVGADGANSWLRKQMQVDCQEKPYHHEAVVAVIETEEKHHCTAYQPFLSSGPLGVLPLSNPNHVAIVWSADPKRAAELMAMSIDDFDRELMNALSGELARTHCLSERKCIPLMQRHAKQYAQDNKVLVGDAAHTIHPLAGQGANLGFMDVACLSEVLTTVKNDNKLWQSSKTLRRYERWRKSENEMMLLTMSAFKSGFSSQSPIAISLRSWGLNATDRFQFLKRCFTQYAVHDNFP